MNYKSHQEIVQQCGKVRSIIYAPLRAIVMDSLYLPAYKIQYSKALLLADCATGKVSIYPNKNLQASTARKSILNYLYTTPAPEYFITDKAGEFDKNLEGNKWRREKK